MFATSTARAATTLPRRFTAHKFLKRSTLTTTPRASSTDTMAEEPDRPPLPPFTAETALKKVKAAEAAWNRKDVDAIAAAYSEDSEWRNRAEFVKGRENIKYVDPEGQWHRAYGNENWEFNAKGYMRKRIASINEAPIDESERRISVPEGAEVKYNSWVTEQGLSDALDQEFPLSNGDTPAY